MSLRSAHVLPGTLPGFEAIRRYRNASGQLIAKLLPGDYYVTRDDEVLDTVLGSCVSACIRNPRLGIGGMNHFMLPQPSGVGADTWDGVAGRATYWLLTALFNVFPLPRLQGFRQSFAHAGEALDRGYSVLIFPEGTRSQTGEIAPFRQGIGLLAVARFRCCLNAPSSSSTSARRKWCRRFLPRCCWPRGKARTEQTERGSCRAQDPAWSDIVVMRRPSVGSVESARNLFHEGRMPTGTFWYVLPPQAAMAR